MQLWTHQPSPFRLDVLPLPLDPKRGAYWNAVQGPDFCYQEVAPLLWELVKTDQFLWCCTLRGMFQRQTADVDLVEWEINAPQSSILAYIDALIWEDIVRGKPRKW